MAARLSTIDRRLSHSLGPTLEVPGLVHSDICVDVAGSEVPGANASLPVAPYGQNTLDISHAQSDQETTLQDSGWQ